MKIVNNMIIGKHVADLFLHDDGPSDHMRCDLCDVDIAENIHHENVPTVYIFKATDYACQDEDVGKRNIPVCIGCVKKFNLKRREV